MWMTMPDGRDWSITLYRDGEEHGVVHLFDSEGSETFDPTAAVEVDLDGDLVAIQADDELRFCLGG